MARPTRTAQMRVDKGGPIATAGAVFPDGTLLELVRDPTDPTELSLLQWKDGRSVIGLDVPVGACRYLPLELDAGVVRHLPSTAAPYASTEELFNDIRDFIAKFTGLSEDEVIMLTGFVFSSFFAECFSMSPCWLLCGPSPVEASAILRLLGCVCRHSVLLVGAGLGVPEQLRPTRLICQPDATVDRLLGALQFSGFGFSQSRALRQLNAATVINVGLAELKSPFAEACLWMPIAPTPQLFSIQDEEREAARIVELQNQLLMYRVQNYAKVKTSTFDVPEFSGSSRELARSLGACIVDAPDLQARLVDQLRERDQAERSERAGKIESVVVEALLVCCHERHPSVHVGEVSRLVNGILARSAEVVKVTAKQVGTILKRLGFRTERLDAGGRGIYLLNGECARVHRVARAYGVPSLREGLPGCPHCKKS
jgi:hypothetical protein